MKITKSILIFVIGIFFFASCTYYIVPNRRVARVKKVIYIEQEPNIILVPGFKVVYYVKAYKGKLFFHKNHWYYFENGIWYRATSWRGPWIAIKRVPRKVIIARKKIIYNVKVIRQKHRKHRKF